MWDKTELEHLTAAVLCHNQWVLHKLRTSCRASHSKCGGGGGGGGVRPARH